jgi:hypothetical protein
VLGALPAACEREGGSTTPVLALAAWFTMGDQPSGVGSPGLCSVRGWPALALCICACTLTRECSVIWALTACYVHVRLLELACMIEIGSAGWVHSARACPRVRARGE